MGGCAGGIGDETQFSDAMLMGFDGCQLGTRFIATDECNSSEAYKQAIIEANEGDIILSEKITGVPVSIINTELVQSQGTKPGKIAQFLLDHPKGKHWMRMIYTIRSAFKLRRSSMDASGKQKYWQAGKSVGAIKSIEAAGDIVLRFKEALLSFGKNTK